MYRQALQDPVSRARTDITRTPEQSFTNPQLPTETVSRHSNKAIHQMELTLEQLQAGHTQQADLQAFRDLAEQEAAHFERNPSARRLLVEFAVLTRDQAMAEHEFG